MSSILYILISLFFWSFLSYIHQLEFQTSKSMIIQFLIAVMVLRIGENGVSKLKSNVDSNLITHSLIKITKPYPGVPLF